MPISGRLGTSGLDSSTASFLRASSEALTLVQDLAGTFDVGDQEYTPGAEQELAIYGNVSLVESGLDGASTTKSVFDVWIPFLLLDDAGFELDVGDRIVQDSTSRTYVVLEFEYVKTFGVYRARCMVAQ